MSKQTKSATEIGSKDENCDFLCTTQGDSLMFINISHRLNMLTINAFLALTVKSPKCLCCWFFFKSTGSAIESFKFPALDDLQRPSGRCKTLARQHFSQSWLNHCRLHVTLVRCETAVLHLAAKIREEHAVLLQISCHAFYSDLI